VLHVKQVTLLSFSCTLMHCLQSF